MDQTLFKFAHSHWPPNDSQLNKAIKSFNNRVAFQWNYSAENHLQILQTQHTSQVPSDTFTKRTTCHLFHQPFSWPDTQSFSSTSYPHISLVLNLSTSISRQVQDLKAGFLFTTTHQQLTRGISFPASSRKSCAQHLANTAPNTSVKEIDKNSICTK
jgi:hypothetical protein